MNLILAALKVFLGAVIGLVLGALAGFYGMFYLAQGIVAMGVDKSDAGALPFFTYFTVPAGALVGAIFGAFLGWKWFKKSRSHRPS
jgi:ABC-type xylose transport system permease subunit